MWQKKRDTVEHNNKKKVRDLAETENEEQFVDKTDKNVKKK